MRQALKFLRKSWRIWAVWVGFPLFIAGLAINPFWTFVILAVCCVGIAFAMSIHAAIEMYRED